MRFQRRTASRLSESVAVTLAVTLPVALAGLVAAAVLSVAVLGAEVAAAPVRVEQFSSPAVSTARATRLEMPADAISVGQSGPMTPERIDLAEQAALAAGVPSVRGRAFTIGLHAVRRGASTVQQASGTSGFWQYPMSVTALPVDALGPVMGHAVAAAVAQGTVVFGATASGLHDVQVGDVVELVAADGGVVSFAVGHVAPDAAVGGAEIVMSPDQSDLLGATVVTRVLIFGQLDRARIDAELDVRGLIDGAGVRVSRSWNPPNPDSLLGSARTKVLLGEFDFRINSDDSLTLDPDWVSANVVRVNFASIGIRASCHQAVIADIQAALTEIAEAGLAFAIDLGNSNTYGGCYNPRYSRVSGSIGAVSRHAWAMALDMNTLTNAQGRTPHMDCRVVRIFRKHNFAWGGNFLVPDGMHFEWVGEPRNTLQYPSKYCPNLPGGGIETSADPDPTPPVEPVVTQRDTMFAEDGFAEAG